MNGSSCFYPVVLAGLVWAVPGGAETFDRGQALYENHCVACHETEIHTGAERRATSRRDIRKWVTTWNFHAGLGWSEEDVGDVTDFLNRRFYRFVDSSSP